MSEPINPNPYASPSLPIGPSFPDVSGGIDYRLQRTIRDFRSQSVALGAAWIVFGILMTGLLLFAIANLSRQQSALLPSFSIAVVLSLSWIACGAFTCSKHLWAVYTGLVLSYMSLVGSLMSFNLCGILILLAIIVQAHRVLGFAKQIREAGLPLTTKV